VTSRPNTTHLSSAVPSAIGCVLIWPPPKEFGSVAKPAAGEVVELNLGDQCGHEEMGRIGKGSEASLPAKSAPAPSLCR